jgi:methionyl-tRNA formyltransferase
MESSMRIIYMGTPDFAVPSLEILLENGFEVVAVVTAPDKPAGRGLQLQSSPVKRCAEEHSIPVLPTFLQRWPVFRPIYK